MINVDVEEQPTGEFSISGGYSTADGLLAEVSVADRNLLGRGQFAKASVTYGQRARGFDLSFVEPYLLGYRMAGGIDLFARQNLASNYVSYDTKTIGTNLRLGFALTEELALQPRYSIYRQEITLPELYNNCILSKHGIRRPALGAACYADGEASLPVRMELADGPVMVSLVGYTLTYNTLDNNKAPDQRLLRRVQAGFRRRRRRREFHPLDGRYAHYYEVIPDIVGVLKLQGGHVTGWGGKDLRMLDHFQMGPNLVRGFAPAGFGPRDLTPGTTNDALGGSDVLGRERRGADAAVFPAEGNRHQARGLCRRRLAVELQRADLLGARTGETLTVGRIPMRFAPRSVSA